MKANHRIAEAGGVTGRSAHRKLLLALSLAFTLGAGAALAQETKDIKIPSGVDFMRAKLLGRGDAMKVYVNMVGIGDPKEEKLLFPRGKSDAVGTHRQMDRRFMDAIQKTQRFEVYDDTSGGIRDKSDVVVDGMIVASTQNIEDFTALRKSVTTVRLSVQIKDTATGKVIKARTLSGVYGDEPGKGTVIRSEGDLGKPDIRQNLANDYEKALTEALENAAAFLERTIRPVARVREFDSDTILLVGGQAHGIRENDNLVVFRAKAMRVGETESFGIMKPVGIFNCSTVSTDSSQCEVKVQGKEWPPQKDDYAVLGDESLKLKME